jgi:RNA polymerase sigma factor (sigma-70 family)
VSVAPQPEGEEGEGSSPAAPAYTDVAALYARHHGVLLRQAMSVLPEDLQDQAGDALMTVIMRLRRREQEGTLTEPANWEAYLVRAVTNACFDIIKKFPVHAPLEPNDDRIHRDAPSDPTGDEVAERIDNSANRRRIRAALESLAPRSHDIVIAKEVEGRTNRDIGKQLGISGQRVGQLYEKALRDLREEVKRHDD